MPILAIEECVPSIRVGDTVELLRDVRGSDLDLVLCETEPPGPAQKGLEIVQLDTLTLVAVGVYGETLPNQNGAPIRLVVPWKYGFKGAKSIVRIRLQEARTLLLASPRDVAGIGHRVGYDSPSQFNREYRRMFGVPPGQDAERLRTCGGSDRWL